MNPLNIRHHDHKSNFHLPGKQVREAERDTGAANIRIIATTVADTSEYGILRIIVSDTQKAFSILKEHNVSANLTEVLAIVTNSSAGSFAHTLACFTKAGISIEYMYCFSTVDKAIMVLRTNNQESAREVIRRQNFDYVTENDLAKV